MLRSPRPPADSRQPPSAQGRSGGLISGPGMCCSASARVHTGDCVVSEGVCGPQVQAVWSGRPSPVRRETVDAMIGGHQMLDREVSSEDSELVESATIERLWTHPAPDRVIAALTALSTNLRPCSIHVTERFGMQTSRYKEDELLWAQAAVTNLTSKILADVWQNLQLIKLRPSLPTGRGKVHLSTSHARRMERQMKRSRPARS